MCIVLLFVFGVLGHVACGVESAVVEPADVFERGDPDIIDPGERALADQLGLVEPVRCFSRCVDASISVK